MHSKPPTKRLDLLKDRNDKLSAQAAVQRDQINRLQRRCEELHSRWQSTIEERSAAVEEVRAQAAAAAARREEIEGRLGELVGRKTALIKQLRDLVRARKIVSRISAFKA